VSLLEEALRSIKAAARLLAHDQAAYAEFNVSVQGFWRSFLAIIPMAAMLYPMTISSARIACEIDPKTNDGIPEFAAAYLTLAIAWAVWPLAAAALSRLFGAGQHYARYVVAYNWASVPLFAVNAIPHVLYGLGGSAFAAGALFVFLIGVYAYYSWYIARTGLQTSAAVAIAFMLADLTLGFGLSAAL
jgi:hypothetical protein